MDRTISRGRLAFIIFLLIVLLSIYGVSLYRLQIIEGAEYYERSQNSIVTTQTVTAARGNILDRYGRLLVSNRACNNIVLDVNELFYSGEIDDPNALLLQLAEIVHSCGDTHADMLPITSTAPFAYVENMTDLQKSLLSSYIEHNNDINDAELGDSPTAVELMAYFRERYKIGPEYDSEQMRIITGLRYEINVRSIVPTADYIFVEDASIELITKLMESNLPGFDVQVSYIREYKTQYAAHVLGYIGAMTLDEYNGVDGVQGYKQKGYPMSALIGIGGAEYAFEDYLHGKDGTASITRTSSGIVTSTVYTSEPEPGNHVYLSIDIGLNEVAENALASNISKINADREKNNAQAEMYGNTKDILQLITGGAVVAIDVKSGEPLCIASYPGYDLENIIEKYNEIMEAENQPLFNRALAGAYAPGSTFKPVTALAGLETGTVTLNTTHYCTGIFEKYAATEDGGYAPRCAGIHGDVNVTGAIEHSCNVYFYTVGDFLGIDRLGIFAKEMGLGEYTGIELGEIKGAMASPERKKELYAHDPLEQGWYQGNTIAAAIGQSVSQFTPIQLANYCATLANSGERYEASILKSVRSYDYSETIYDRRPVVANNADYDKEYYEAIQLGMRHVVSSGESPTVFRVFDGVKYTVAAKTGTAQTGEERTNDGLFICYAPYEDPEIAVAVVIEKGGSGAEQAIIAKEVLDYYFNFKNSTTALERELEILR